MGVAEGSIDRRGQGPTPQSDASGLFYDAIRSRKAPRFFM
jgi:hypothetical protein